MSRTITLSDLGKALTYDMSGGDLVRMLIATEAGKRLLHQFFRDVLKFVGDYPQIDLMGGQPDIVGRGSGPTGHALRDRGAVVLGLRLDVKTEKAGVYLRQEEGLYRGFYLPTREATLGSLDMIKDMNPKDIARRMIEAFPHSGLSKKAGLPVGRRAIMSRTITASDRRRLIRLVSSMTAGSPERRAVLAGLERQSATRPSVEIAPGQEDDDILAGLDINRQYGVDFEVTLVLEGRELAKVLGVQERVLARTLDRKERFRDPLIPLNRIDTIFDMKRKSIHTGAMKAMADLLDYGTDFDIDLDGPQDNPYLSIKRIKPDAVQVTFEVGSIIEMR